MKLVKAAAAIIAVLALGACGKTNFNAQSDSTDKSATSASTVDDVRRQVEQDETPDEGCVPSYAQTQCSFAKFQKFFTEIADGGSIVSMQGNLLYRGNHVTEVRDVRGNFIFLGEGDDAKIDLISDARGNHIICNADVGVLNMNSVGNVVIVGGSLGAVEDFNGNLVVDGTIGSIKNSHGNIVGAP